MSLAIGIVGLPNVGKSTLFNALASASAAASNYPFCTLEPNLGTVPVPDDRLTALASLLERPAVPTHLRFVDIAGLVRGASRGEGLGNQFLAHIRDVDAVLHVCRLFANPDVVHVEGDVDPVRDVQIVDTELMLKDLETLEKRRRKAESLAKAAGPTGAEAKAELSRLDRLQAQLNQGVPVRAQNLDAAEQALVRELFLLTAKPVIYAANIDERAVGKEGEDPNVQALRAHAAQESAPVIPVAAELEAEIQALAPEERGAFLSSAGLAEPALHRLVREAYQRLGLITFFTTNEKEVRAWTVAQGTPAPRAAGTIHSDFERGFIKAQVMRVSDLLELKSEHAVREHGKMRTEGRDYLVQDGDLILFAFNV